MVNINYWDYCMVLLGIIIIVSYIASIIVARKEEKEEQEKANERINNAFRDATDSVGVSDILKTMNVNMLEMRGYYNMSKKQATNSFRLAFLTLLLGVGLIVIAFGFALTKDAQLVTILLPAVGGAITQLFAGATLAIYNQTLRQANLYYRYLHENERFLSAVSIAQRVGDDKRDALNQHIVEKQMLYTEQPVTLDT